MNFVTSALGEVRFQLQRENWDCPTGASKDPWEQSGSTAEYPGLGRILSRTEGIKVHHVLTLQPSP